MERERPRTARSSLMGVSVQRAPDFRNEKSKNIQELITFIQKWGIDSPERFTQKVWLLILSVKQYCHVLG